MSKAKDNIGTIRDPHTGEIVPIRRNVAGVLYYLSPEGCIRLNADSLYIETNGELWTDGPPPNCPDWIKNNLGKPPRVARPPGRPRTVTSPEPSEPEPAKIQSEIKAIPETKPEPEAKNEFALW
jgi:hypothetical protein